MTQDNLKPHPGTCPSSPPPLTTQPSEKESPTLF